MGRGIIWWRAPVRKNNMILLHAKQCSVYREPVVDWAFIEAYRGRAPEFAGEIAYFVANTQPIDSISSGYFSFMTLI